MKILHLPLLLLFMITANSGFSQIKKYCYSTYNAIYEMALYDDGSKKAVYRMYNTSGVLQKTMQGEWMLRDEGVYGTAYKITITWTGVNSGMSELKFLAQYDGYGNLQGIIDSKDRIWDTCR